ncbi:MAG: bifunctional metallophosphatase/5'-nucleotidase [Gammaproteobacteria bacterium]|nr:bifunctional metallophosphatase/5'-nucleotidase [Gammaproteobacteria bacterium]NNL45190.1 bifunctional metallophosphatase/5'-nucleotidase [Woeseiaceae bacterium]
MTSRNFLSRAICRSITALIVTVALASCATQRGATRDEFTVSVFGTNDVHGQLLPDGDRGGLVAVSAYINALRAARDEDGGAVLVIDAGDMWQGTLESNLVEGAAVVEAYNAIGFDAAAMGNHEFDFGPVGSKAVPEGPGDDARGALKLRAGEADFAVLAANLIDEQTGRPIDWENVRPSVILDVNGIIFGIVGVMTSGALQTTIAANVIGLRVAPLAETITKEARALRDQGAAVIIVTAHAGSSCKQFEDPTNLSSCDMAGEIMRVASALPPGLVDHIIAGHVHRGIAHIVNDISITSSYSNTRAFSRVDFGIEAKTGKVVSRTVFPPHWACLSVVRSSGECASPGDTVSETATAVYEGHAVEADPRVLEIAAHAAAFAENIKRQELGVHLDSRFENPASTEAPLANLMTDALLESTGADIVIHNVIGGIRNALPQGELTFGSVYEMFPFDNRVVELELTGHELRTIIAEQAHNHGRRAGFSGMRVFVECTNDKMDVVMELDDGRTIRDADRLSVIVNDYLALGGDGILTSIVPEGGFDVENGMPLTRDVLVEWFQDNGDSLKPEDYMTSENPKWNVPDPLPSSCAF